MDKLPHEVKYLLDGETEPRSEICRDRETAGCRAAEIMREHRCALCKLTIGLAATD